MKIGLLNLEILLRAGQLLIPGKGLRIKPCHHQGVTVCFDRIGGGWAPVSSPVFKTGGGSVKRAAVGSTPIHPRLVFGGEYDEQRRFAR